MKPVDSDPTYTLKCDEPVDDAPAALTRRCRELRRAADRGPCSVSDHDGFRYFRQAQVSRRAASYTSGKDSRAFLFVGWCTRILSLIVEISDVVIHRAFFCFLEDLALGTRSYRRSTALSSVRSASPAASGIQSVGA
ncbi:hypothetical protein [Nocardia terpenica]|uniref:Uncharacterized protein n=1 Tax=Nocardia terpenica TaxID=455432 RepID=A0A6G9YV04_9NOCA|nr:hypothetical protein [Nocardia terpenica]QIS16957.1 hypothetical protein F6W96_00105 [Nocardia terpenica]